MGSDGMSVQELADRLACNSGDVLKALFMQGIMAQVNQVCPELISPREMYLHEFVGKAVLEWCGLTS